MMIGWWAMIFVAATPAPVPPPIAQDVANCAAPTYASDQEVCSDPALAALDNQLKTLLPIPPLPDTVRFEEQGDWFRRSRLCAMRKDHYACLRGAYRERIAVVTALREFQRQAPQWQSVRCGKLMVQTAALAPGVLAVQQQETTLLALTATELASWTPFAWARRNGSKLEIRGPDGMTLRCSEINPLPAGSPAP